MAENQKDRNLLYKNCAKNPGELRTRRRDVTLELRKTKKEDQLFKRRNINDDEVTSPLKDSNGQSPVQMSIEEIILGMHSTDNAQILESTQAARKMLSREMNPPIDVMIGHGIVPLCVQFLDRFDNPNLQFEAAWALTNVASGTSKQTMSVVEADAIPKFVKLLTSPTSIVAEQAVWALGNIAGDGAVTRDIVLNTNTIEGLVPLVNNETPISFLRNIVWLMSNLCRNKNPMPPFDKVQVMLPILSELLCHSDHQVLTDASWAISYITDDENQKIQAVINAGCVPHLVRLLDLENQNVIVPALRSVGNIVTGTDAQTDSVIAAGGLQNIKKLLQNSKNSIVKEAAWTISNITAGNPQQIQHVIDADIFPYICSILEKGDFKAQKEAAWVITNTTTSGTPEQVITLIQKYGILKPFGNLLTAKDARTIKVILSGLTNIFQLAEKLNGVENLCVLIEENGTLDKLESLQRHDNEEVYKAAYLLIDKYFIDEDATDENALAPTENEGALQFSGNSANNAPPEGGFTF